MNRILMTQINSYNRLKILLSDKKFSEKAKSIEH
jgi:hypothetical protein